MGEVASFLLPGCPHWGSTAREGEVQGWSVEMFSSSVNAPQQRQRKEGDAR